MMNPGQSKPKKSDKKNQSIEYGQVNIKPVYEGSDSEHEIKPKMVLDKPFVNMLEI